MVSGEEKSSPLVVQDEVEVRVSRGVQDPGFAISERDLISVTERDQVFRHADAEPRCPCGRPSRPFVHPVAHQISDETLRAPLGVPDVAGVLDLTLQHPDRRPAPLLQPAGEPDVIRVQVRHYYALHAPIQIQANLCGALLPGLARRGIVEAGVYDRPPVAAFDQVGRDEPERERHRELELVDAFRDAGGFAYGLSSEGRGRNALAHGTASRGAPATSRVNGTAPLRLRQFTTLSQRGSPGPRR